MAKHKGDMRDAIALGPDPAIALILEPGDAPLIEKLLMHYANEIYFGASHDAHKWRGYKMKHWEAKRLAHRIRRVYRGSGR